MKTLIRLASPAALAAMAAGCSRQPEQRQQQASAPNPASAIHNEAGPSVPPPGTEPDGRTPLVQPTQQRPTIDPKSTEAAGELVAHFVRLLNAGRFDDAYMLLGPAAPPRSQFDRQFSPYSDIEVTPGTPGDQQGAAGSIYVSVPLTVSGALGGKRSSRAATAILRRVNDVPGSTEAQRHWHIERIDWGNAT
jgi:hypothetical protein